MSSDEPVVAFTWIRPATGGHEDLSIRVGSWTHTCDSYFFAIEAEDIGPTAAAVVQVMQALLRQWNERVLQLADGDVVYLPFDFSDQATIWIRAQRAATELQLQVGWSNLEGYSFLPSDFSAVQPSDWKKLDGTPTVLTTTDEWERAVAISSAALRLHAEATPTYRN
jgi:hypothetical protein